MENLSGKNPNAEKTNAGEHIEPLSILEETPSFEEHMKELEGEKIGPNKNAEIEEIISEMEGDNANVFIAGRTNGISRIDAFGVERGKKVKSETGEINDRKMSEQYAIWRLAKDIASSYSQEDPRHTRMKALRDFSIVQRLWDGASLDAQKKDCNDKLTALDERMTTAVKERPNEPMSMLRWVDDYIHLVEDYDSNLLRLDSIEKVTGDIAPYIQEYEEYEQILNKTDN